MRKQDRICFIVSVIMAVFLTAGIIEKRECRAAEKIAGLQEELAQEVFRFHVRANSDREEDQTLKLKVKDAVITYMKKALPDSDSAKETKDWAIKHQEELIREARRVIRSEGYDYSVQVQIGPCKFPDKTYGDITFPAGMYEALEILIGNASGRNWWCVLYPNLCFVDAMNAVVPKEGKIQLQNVLTEEEYEIVSAYTDFKIKWFFFGK